MTRCIAVLTVAYGIATLFPSQASAQPWIYHHHSTAQGDFLGGSAELTQAQGQFAKDVASAAEIWVRVAAAQDDLQYKHYENHLRCKQVELEYRESKRQAIETRNELKDARRLAEARQLWTDAKNGYVRWPAALNGREYATSLSLVESLLRTWPESDGYFGPIYRKSLATELGVLRSKISHDKKVPFHQQVDAIQTLDGLELAARIGMDEASSASHVSFDPAAQLAYSAAR